MSGWRSWSIGAKLMTSSVVCLLLSIGLCGYGIRNSEPEPHDLAQFAGICGLLLLGLSVLLFFAGIIAALQESLRR